MAGNMHYPGIIVTSCYNYILGIHGIQVFQLYSRRAKCNIKRPRMKVMVPIMTLHEFIPS